MSQDEPIIHCDPCQVKDNNTGLICGWQGRSLSMHLKKHKKKNGAIITIKEYRARFPKFDVGKPSFSPPPEAIAKFLAAAPGQVVNNGRRAEIAAEEKAFEIELDKAVEERLQELWNMCERDPAAKIFCFAVAKDESLLKAAHDRGDRARKAKKYDEMKWINQDIAAISERLNTNMKALSLTVEQRRKNNTLGNDTVSQLISNFANTLRKMSPDKQEAFERRVEAVNAAIAERVRLTVLAEVEDGFDQTDKVTDDTDYRKAIARISEKAR